MHTATNETLNDEFRHNQPPNHPIRIHLPSHDSSIFQLSGRRVLQCRSVFDGIDFRTDVFGLTPTQHTRNHTHTHKRTHVHPRVTYARPHTNPVSGVRCLSCSGKFRILGLPTQLFDCQFQPHALFAYRERHTTP